MSTRDIKSRQGPNSNINIRVKDCTRALIERASAITGKSITDFILDAACREVEDVLLERRLFNLDSSAFQAFMAALDAPPKSNPQLRALLNRNPLWED